MLTSDWPLTIENVKPHVVKIQTPELVGTGFLVANTPDSSMMVIATADHVVTRALFWEQPIRLQHTATGKSVLLRPGDRAIIPQEKYDTAAIFLAREKLPSLPAEPLKMFGDKSQMLRIGSEAGWLGFPANGFGRLCFFSGRISAWITSEEQYLVDGVAIHGVSGGPAFVGTGTSSDVPQLIGVVSAYLANRATGEALPGLCSIRSVVQFQVMADEFDSLAKAQKRQAEATPEQSPPLPASVPSISPGADIPAPPSKAR